MLTALYTQLSGAAPVIPEAARDAAEDVSRKEAQGAGRAGAPGLARAGMPQARDVADPATWTSSGSSAATAVQDAVLTDTGMPPERVFLARDGKVSANEQQVRFELAVK